MSPQSKREYTEAVVLRYKRAPRSKKTAILNGFCDTLGYNRKYVIRLLRTFTRFTQPKPRKRGRCPIYSKEEVLTRLKRIWLAANLPCSKRLKVILPLWLPGYSETFEPLSLDAVKTLRSISSATIDRILKPARAQHKTHGRSATKPGTLLRKQIPIQTNQWDESRPGSIEADTVAHCGQSLSGVFAYTIDFVDIATGWTEQRAIWGKGETNVLEQITDVEECLPFPLLGFDCDNGSEFLNHHLLRHFTDKKVRFTRSRAYHKDDNAHIEQKNWSHVRQWIGYDRLDDPCVVELLNDLYRSEWRLFHNFFCPSVKLVEKERVGSKTIKHHDCPKTPYQRIMESPLVSGPEKQRLTRQFTGLNPFSLRRAMETKLQRIFASPINRSCTSSVPAPPPG
jgi:hypothetical protein